MMTPTAHLDELSAKVTDKVLTFFGKEEVSSDWEAEARAHIKSSIEEAATVQCVGMDRPVDLLTLYQPTRFKPGPDLAAMRIEDLVDAAEHSIIYAGPGQGKTTVLKYLLLTQAGHSTFVPLLFALRSPKQVRMFEILMQVFVRRRTLNLVPTSGLKILLLVDGFDEISEDLRAQVSDLLGAFRLLRAGVFLLTCRAGYTVSNLKARVCELAQFERQDAVRFVDAFGRALGTNVRGEQMVRDLETRRLTYIANHPLMLTLACVVKSRVNPDLPHNSVELLRQAIETLTFRWDEGKEVKRVSHAGLLAVHMLECAMRVAHDMRGLSVPRQDVLTIVREYLELLHSSNVRPELVVEDIQRFFGLIVTTADNQVQFVHKTLQDYLAARFLVENGLFKPAMVQEWDMKAAYCACLVHDATQSIHAALVNSRGVEAVRECMLNNARFKPHAVANAVFSHFDRWKDYMLFLKNGELSVRIQHDFFDIIDDSFLDAIAEKARAVAHTNGAEAILAACLSEYRRRCLGLQPPAMSYVKAIFSTRVERFRVSRLYGEDAFAWSEIENLRRPV